MDPDEIRAVIQQEVQSALLAYTCPEILIHPFTEAGGKMPERMSDGAIGWDCLLRALVDPDRSKKHPQFPYLRATIFDFETWPNTAEGRDHVKEVDKLEGPGKELIWVLRPGEQVMGGIGFTTAMNGDWGEFYWVSPRSGMASIGVTLANAPGTVDADYRGEAGVLIRNNSSTVFELRKDMRIVQVIFCRGLLPKLQLVESYGDLPTTVRGAGGFGSTGIYVAK